MSALLTTKQAAEALGLSPETLKTWRCRQPERLPFRQQGRIIRYEAAVIERFGTEAGRESVEREGN